MEDDDEDAAPVSEPFFWLCRLFSYRCAGRSLSITAVGLIFPVKKKHVFLFFFVTREHVVKEALGFYLLHTSMLSIMLQRKYDEFFMCTWSRVTTLLFFFFCLFERSPVGLGIFLITDVIY